jgi:hypothetical protein
LPECSSVTNLPSAASQWTRKPSDMSWFRERLGWGSCIALFALAFQIAVSFGHVHRDAVAGHSSIAIEASNGSTQPGGDTSDPADRYCAICALIHFAGTLVLSQPPVVLLPIVFAKWQPDAAVRFGFTPAPPSFFPARAPPLA